MPTKEPQFRQAKTAQLAPDALVFVNGSDTMKDDNGNVYELRNNVTDLNVSLNIDSTPGTAGFTLSVPDYSIRRSGDIRFENLTLMSEVEIYFKGRFQNKYDKYPYYPTFWGVVISVVENYSDGVNTISVSCADILRWWEITSINISPSLISQSEMRKFVTEYNKIIPKDHQRYYVGETVTNADGVAVSMHGNKYAGKTIPEILIDISQITTQNMMPIRNALDAAFGTTDKIDAELIGKSEATPTDAEVYIMKYWSERLNRIGRNLRIFGLKQDGGTVNLDNEEFGDVKPYPLSEGSPNAMESVMKSQLEIAKELKDSIQFEFFMDVNGELIFKPPFYNLNVITNRNSIIEDLDIVSWTYNRSEAEMYSRCDVVGSWSQAFISGKDVVKGIALDVRMSQRFGIRAITRQVNWLNSKENCLIYAKGELNKLNALAYQGSVTIIGRPELRLGYPIYVPSRDAFYYIKGIDHSFSFGGTFQTTLTLVAERKRLYTSDGEPYKDGAYVNQDKIEDGNVTVEGGSIANDSDNFMKQLSNPCFQQKSEQQFDIVEPNFAKNLDNVLSMGQGDWKSVEFKKLVDPDPLKEYQFTDGKGYELIPFFKYGKDLVWSDGKVTPKPKDSNDKTDNNKNDNAEKAKKAQTINLQMTVNPNNVALTLDKEDTSMLYIFDKSNRSAARKAQNVDTTR